MSSAASLEAVAFIALIKELTTMAEQASLSGLTEQQAKEFHEQFKITYTAFVGIAAVVHLFVIAANPWF
jgi:light-harvesting complex 1 beta chain